MTSNVCRRSFMPSHLLSPSVFVPSTFCPSASRRGLVLRIAHLVNLEQAFRVLGALLFFLSATTASGFFGGNTQLAASYTARYSLRKQVSIKFSATEGSNFDNAPSIFNPQTSKQTTRNASGKRFFEVILINGAASSTSLGLHIGVLRPEASLYSPLVRSLLRDASKRHQIPRCLSLGGLQGPQFAQTHRALNWND